MKTARFFADVEAGLQAIADSGEPLAFGFCVALAFSAPFALVILWALGRDRNIRLQRDGRESSDR